MLPRYHVAQHQLAGYLSRFVRRTEHVGARRSTDYTRTLGGGKKEKEKEKEKRGVLISRLS